MKLGRLLVTVGMLLTPAAQWVVFWLLARQGDAGAAGTFSLVLAVSTPVFTLTNYGLRNSYITLRERFPFQAFLGLRVLGSIIALGFLAVFALAIHGNFLVLIFVTIQKLADAISDIIYAWFQREQRLAEFGISMLLNGLLTIVCAVVLAATTGSAVLIVAATALGSLSSMAYSAIALCRLNRGRARDCARHRVPGTAARILRASTSITGGQLFSILVTNVPVWIVGISGSVSEVGRFAGAAYVLTLGSLVGSVLNSVYIGDYQAMLGAGKLVELKRHVLRGTVAVTVCGLLATVAAFLVGGPILGALYGSGFTVGPWELAVLTLAAALNPGTYLMNASLLALNLYREQLLIVLWATVATALFLVPAALGIGSGILLASAAALAGSLVKFGLSIIVLRRALHGATRD